MHHGHNGTLALWGTNLIKRLSQLQQKNATMAPGGIAVEGGED
jgi:hypothetical protein